MGQRIFKSEQTRARRRLGGETAEDLEYSSADLEFFAGMKRFEFKPFGSWNYSYPTQLETVAGAAIWILMTAGGLAVDWREAAIVLGVCMYLQERDLYVGRTYGCGNSWVSNVQAGYLFYQWWARNNKRYIVKGPALWGIFGGLGVYLYDWSIDWEFHVAHRVHFTGFMEGIVTAFLLDKIFTRKQPLI